MNLYLKQKIFSFRDKFNVYDSFGNVRYSAASEIISFGKKLHVYDTNGSEVIYIRQRLVTLLPKYEVSVLGGDCVEIVKDFTLFRHEYSIPEWGIKVHGDFFAHEYTVEQNGVAVAHMSKEWLSWGDTYGITIADSFNELVALAVILVIDCCMERKNNGK